MKIKKVIAIVIVLAVLVGSAAGGVYGYKSYQSKKLVIEVQPVSNMNYGYWGDDETSYGMVTNDSLQEVYLEDSGKVEEIYVAEGDTVEEGDPLVRYDISDVEMELKRKNLEMSNLSNTIAVENHELEVLKKTQPVDKKRPNINLSHWGIESTEDMEDTEYTGEEDYTDLIPERDERDERIYNYVTGDSIPYNAQTADGSEQNPYVYYCNKGAYAFGSFYNSIRATDGGMGKHVVLIVCKKDKDGKMVMEQQALEPGDEELESTEVEAVPVFEVPLPDETVENNYIRIDGNALPTSYDDESTWYVFSGEEADDALSDLLDSILDMEDWEEPEGYTKEELAEAIQDKEEELKRLDIERRKGELELESLKASASDGIVYAKINGVVKSVASEDGGSDNDPLVVVTGDEGLYVSGTVSELQLDKVQPGTIVMANSWESGMNFEATVTEISDYPTSGNSWGEGNPNVSYYRYTAHIEDSSALKNGESVDLSIQAESSAGDTKAIYIEKAYVRQEDGRSYVMIADENNLLKKQYVTTGKTIYGSAVEIKSGLSEEDRIAFPYGKEAVEGTPVTDADDTYYY